LTTGDDASEAEDAISDNHRLDARDIECRLWKYRELIMRETGNKYCTCLAECYRQECKEIGSLIALALAMAVAVAVMVSFSACLIKEETDVIDIGASRAPGSASMALGLH
jgi:hypothetical protein